MLHNMYEKIHNGWKMKTHDDIIWKKSGTMDEELKKSCNSPSFPRQLLHTFIRQLGWGFKVFAPLFIALFYIKFK